MMFKATVLAAALAAANGQGGLTITSFETTNNVADQNFMDVDQDAVNTLVGLGSEVNFQQAFSIYQNGYGSLPVAMLHLNTTAAPGITAGTAVTGTNVKGSVVSGVAYADTSDTPNDDNTFTLQVQYDITKDMTEFCRVGTGDYNPVTDGCFVNAADSKVMVGPSDDQMEYTYTYDVNTENANMRTIMSFTQNPETDQKPLTPVNENVEVGDDGYYTTFQKFVDYYGSPTYGHEWMNAAFNKLKTDYTNGDADFRGLEFGALSQSVKKGTNYMIIAMWAIRNMERAVDYCYHEDMVNAQMHLDEAVAYYSGSMEGEDLTATSGKLFYNLADKRCKNFGTCGANADEDDGVANVNIESFEQFALFKVALTGSDCESAKAAKDEIIKQMFIPMIQGTLKYGWTKDYENSSFGQEDANEGNVFAQSVLPMVHACDADAALELYTEMDLTEQTATYADIRLAFECNFACLGITCAQVGGQTDDGENYREGDAPCDEPPSSCEGFNESSANGIGTKIGFALMVITGLLSMAM